MTRTRILYRAPNGCTCYRHWGLCPACEAWNTPPAPVWYVDGRPAVPEDYCRHGRLVCDRCAHDVGDPRPSQAWGATV